MDNIEHDALGKKKACINSKIKGNKNELAAAKFMTKWTGVKFARTPGSGGLRWVNSAAVCGDITCEDQDYKFPFTIEAKAYKKVGLTLNRKNSKIFTFWEQAKADAKRAKKLPMLLVRINGMPKDEFVVYVKCGDKSYLELECTAHYVGGGLIGFYTSTLLKWVKFSTFVKYQNNQSL